MDSQVICSNTAMILIVDMIENPQKEDKDADRKIETWFMYLDQAIENNDTMLYGIKDYFLEEAEDKIYDDVFVYRLSKFLEDRGGPKVRDFFIRIVKNTRRALK